MLFSTLFSVLSSAIIVAPIPMDVKTVDNLSVNMPQKTQENQGIPVIDNKVHVKDLVKAMDNNHESVQVNNIDDTDRFAGSCTTLPPCTHSIRSSVPAKQSSDTKFENGSFWCGLDKCLTCVGLNCKSGSSISHDHEVSYRSSGDKLMCSGLGAYLSCKCLLPSPQNTDFAERHRNNCSADCLVASACCIYLLCSISPMEP